MIFLHNGFSVFVVYTHPQQGQSLSSGLETCIEGNLWIFQLPHSSYRLGTKEDRNALCLFEVTTW